MDKNLYRTLRWHLLYCESLLDVARDIKVDEEILKLLVLQTAQIEKILSADLPQGGGAVRLSCLRREIVFFHAFLLGTSVFKCAMSKLQIIATPSGIVDNFKFVAI